MFRLKTVLCLIMSTLVFVTASLAASQREQAVDAVLNDPSLLQTPQAQRELQKRGLSADEALRMAREQRQSGTADGSSASSRTDDSTRALDARQVVESATQQSDQQRDRDQRRVAATQTDTLEEQAAEQLRAHPLRYRASGDVFTRLYRRQIRQEVGDLPRFGQSFLDGRDDLPATPGVPAHYRLSPGDALVVQLYGSRSDRWQLQVDESGRAMVGDIGPLQLAGLPYSEVQQLIRDRVAKAYVNADALVSLEELSSIQIAVTGRVEAPGSYMLRSVSTLREALQAAGGILDAGSYRDIQLRRGEEIVQRIDLYDLIASGEESAGSLLQSGDRIHVPPVALQVQLAGAVRQPAQYDLQPGQTLQDLVRLAGGLAPEARRKGLEILRHQTDAQGLRSLIVDADQNIALRDGDLVRVYPVDEENIQAVRLLGNLVRPGLREIEPRTSLGDLFRSEIDRHGMRGTLLPGSQLDQVLVRRMNDDVQEELLRADLQAILDGDASADIRLQPRDRIYVLNRAALMPEPYVYVRGNALANPGKVAWVPGMRLQDVLSAVGLRVPVFDSPEAESAQKTSPSQDPQRLIALLYDTDDLIYRAGQIARNQRPGKDVPADLQAPLKDEDPELLAQYADQLAQQSEQPPTSYLPHIGAPRIDRTRVRVVSYPADSVLPRVDIVDMDRQPDYELPPFSEISFADYYEQHPLQSVRIRGAVARPGIYPLGEQMDLAALVRAAGGPAPDAYMPRLRLQRRSVAPDGSGYDVDQQFYSLRQVLDGQVQVALRASDQVRIYHMDEVLDRPQVDVRGEVREPGSFDVGASTSLQDAIMAAGGFTEKADRSRIELVRYQVQDGERRKQIHAYTHQDLQRAPIPLQPHDEIAVFRIPNWNERQQIVLEGEVRYPGTYTIGEGDRLADVLRRAGGFTDQAFVRGAIFTRAEVRELQRERMQQSLARLRKELVASSLDAAEAGETQQDKQRLLDYVDQLEIQAQEYAPLGRVAMQLSRDFQKLAESPYNLIIKNGDRLHVPSFRDTVTIMGEVLNPTTIVWREDLHFEDYLQMAGGINDRANEDEIIVISPDGTARRGDERGSGWWLMAGGAAPIEPGSTIVVPMEIRTKSGIAIAKDITSVVYQLALAAASMKTLGAF